MPESKEILKKNYGTCQKVTGASLKFPWTNLEQLGHEYELQRI